MSHSALHAAAQVDWNLPAGPAFDHRLSDGSPLPEGFRFQIGTFTDDFVPTAANTADWLDHWRGLSAAEFGVGGGISVAYLSDTNPTAFPPSQTLYAFGYRIDAGGPDEVILLTDSTWTMPSASEILPVGLDLGINLASDPILGSLDGTRSLQTAQTSLGGAPALYYAEWRLDRFGQLEQNDPLISGPSADPDGDGLDNALEYLIGGDPNSWTVNPLEISPHGSGQLRLSAHWNSSARAAWTLRQSPDLQAWNDATDQPLPNAAFDALELIITPGSATDFWRLRVDSVVP